MSNELEAMWQHAKNLQDQFAGMRESLSESTVTGTSADGRIAVTVSAAGDFKDVRLNPDLLESVHPEDLEDMLLAALRDASAQLRQLTEERVGALSADIAHLGGF